MLTPSLSADAPGCLVRHQEAESFATWKGNVCEGNETIWAGVSCMDGSVARLQLGASAISSMVAWGVAGGVLPTNLSLLSGLKSFGCFYCGLSGEAL